MSSRQGCEPQPGFTYNGGEGYQEGPHQRRRERSHRPDTTSKSAVWRSETPKPPASTGRPERVVTSFLQDKTALERGLFTTKNTLPEELTRSCAWSKIVRERYPS